MSQRIASKHFYESLASGGSHDELTYDVDAFTSLQDKKRSNAINELLRRAAKRDARAIETLGFAKDAQLVDQLTPWSQGDPGPVRSAARRALVRLQPSKEHIANLQLDMIEYPAQVSSVYSTLLLNEVGAAVEVQLATLRNPNSLARYHAYTGLIEHFELHELEANFFGRIRRLKVLNGIQLPTPLIEGADGLQAIFKALNNGASPESLHLGYTPGTYGHTVQGILDILNANKPFPPLPIDAMRKLDGQDAEWLRPQLFARLHRERSTRTLEALLEIKPEGWRTILEEEERFETERCAQGVDNEDSDWLLELRAAIAELD